MSERQYQAKTSQSNNYQGESQLSYRPKGTGQKEQQTQNYYQNEGRQQNRARSYQNTNYQDDYQGNHAGYDNKRYQQETHYYREEEREEPLKYKQEQEEESNGEEPEDDEDIFTPTEEQDKYIRQKQNFCKQNIPILKTDEVRKICIDFDFEEEKIDAYFKCFEIDKKYQGISAYEWQETKTRDERKNDKHRKQMDLDRKEMVRRRQERFRKEKDEQRREYARAKEERKKAFDARQDQLKIEKDERDILKKEKQEIRRKEASERKQEATLVYQKKERKEDGNVVDAQQQSAEDVKESDPVEENKRQGKGKGNRKDKFNKGEREQVEWVPKVKQQVQEENKQASLSQADKQASSTKDSVNPKKHQSDDDDSEYLLRKAANASKDQETDSVKHDSPVKNTQSDHPVALKKEAEPVSQNQQPLYQVKQPAQTTQQNFNAPSAIHTQSQPVQQQVRPQQVQPQLGGAYGQFPQQPVMWSPEQQQMMYQQMMIQQQMLQQYQQQIYNMQSLNQTSGGQPPQMFAPSFQGGQMMQQAQPSNQAMFMPGYYPPQYQAPNQSKTQGESGENAGGKK